MSKDAKELLKQYVGSQNFTTTQEVMAAMKDMFRDVLHIDSHFNRKKITSSASPLFVLLVDFRKRLHFTII